MSAIDTTIAWQSDVPYLSVIIRCYGKSGTLRTNLAMGPLGGKLTSSDGSQSLEGQFLVRPEDFGAIPEYHSLIFAPHFYSIPLQAEGAFSPNIAKFKAATKMAPAEKFIIGL